MSNTPYLSFANRLTQALTNKGYIALRSTKGTGIKILTEIMGTSEQICRRYLRGDAMPSYQKIQQLADYLNVNPGWLVFGDAGDTTDPSKQIDKKLLHYILKKSHYLYASSQPDNEDYADFVLQLIAETSNIDTSLENLFKIIDVAIASVFAYEEKRQKQDVMLDLG